MHSLTFKCTFLSDVILDSSTATESSSPSLHYIPGSNFLGIVAAHYHTFNNEDSFNIFHSGNVRFGDAHIVVNNNRSLKMPASWFFAKDDGHRNEPFILHYITKTMREDFISNGIQLKQVRAGYFDIANHQDANIDTTFSIKSAYDCEKRRSADEQLYGYNALRKGSEWLFSVEAEDEKLLNIINEKLKGKHNIGRSRSSQYGRVKIEEHSPGVNSDPVEIVDSKGSRFLVIYFESCAAFIDKYGEATFKPSMYDLKTNLDNSDFVWKNSQILTRCFAPWNKKRNVRDEDRVCIDKGSVLVIKINNQFDLNAYKDTIANGIGIYRQEGFGKVIINPEFLSAKSEAKLQYTLKKRDQNGEVSIDGIINEDESDGKIINWIEDKIKMEKTKILELTNKFMKDEILRFKNISPSQWGSVREIVTRNKDSEKIKDLLFRKPSIGGKDNTGFLYRGKAEKGWRGCRDILEKSVTKINDTQTASKFLICLCSEMAKKKGNSYCGNKPLQ